MYENDFDVPETRGAETPKRGELMTLSEELMRGSEVLAKEIAALTDKLGPVLENVPEPSDREVAERSHSTELGVRLSTVANNLSSAQGRLRALRGRVAL